MTDNELKEHCLQEAGIDLERYSFNELNVIKDALRRYHNAKLKLLSIADVSGMLCGSFEPDNRTSSATKCKCGREKWEHPKPRN